MFAFLDNFTRRLVRRGLRQGFSQGSIAWLVVGAASWLVRLLFRPEPPRVIREEIRLGETIVVHHAPAPPTRRQRRRAARSAKGVETPPSATT